MTLGYWNGSEMRLGHILSITSIIEVSWTRISSTKIAFQGSEQMLRNTLLIAGIDGTGLSEGCLLHPWPLWQFLLKYLGYL